MAAPDFAKFVQENREKKKTEQLAQQILGSGGNRGRKANAGSGAGGPKSRVESEKPSLLSRINGAGVQKRSASAKPAGSIEGKWQHDLHKLNNPHGAANNRRNLSRTASASQVERNSRTYDKFVSVAGRNAGPRGGNDTRGFSIKGVANGGPCTVIASNFADGTTAADIEAVMSLNGVEILGCRLISAAPTVMAELQISNREGAETVIGTFNNQKADGRLLYVYMKDVPASTHLAQTRSQGRQPFPNNYPRAPPARLAPDDMDMDIDMSNNDRYAYNNNNARRDPPRGPRRRY